MAAVDRLRRWHEEQPFCASQDLRRGEDPDAGSRP